VTVYPGDYVKYREEKARRALQDEAVPRRDKEPVLPPVEQTVVKKGDPVRRELQRKAHERNMVTVEKEIEVLELKLKDLESRLSDPETYRLGESPNVIGEHRKVQETLRQKYEEWENLEKNPPL
jgi:ATP-binding cassette subfamily F protein 3